MLAKPAEPFEYGSTLVSPSKPLTLAHKTINLANAETLDPRPERPDP